MIIYFLGFLFFSVSLEATITGKIINRNNGKSIPNASIYLKKNKTGTNSNSYGDFELKYLENGIDTIKINNIGFTQFSAPVDLDGSNIEISIELDPKVLQFSEISVEGIFSTRLGYESVDIMTKKEFQEYEKKSITDVLRLLPGVEAQFAHPNGRNANLSIRGSSDYKPGGYNNRVLVLLDGFPIQIPNSGVPDWSSIPTENIQRIEFDNSPASTQYGHNSMGGVINLITYNKMDKKVSQFSIKGGSFSSFGSSFYKKFYKKKWDYSFSGNFRTSGGHRKNSDDTSSRIRSYLTYDDSYGRTYRFSHILSYSDIGHPGFDISPSLRRSERISNYIQLHSFYPINRGFSMSHSIFTNQFNTKYYDKMGTPLNDLEGERRYDDIAVGLRSESLITKWERGILMIGIDTEWTKSTVTVFNPVYKSPRQFSFGTFFQTKYSIGSGWNIGFGYRYDYRLTDPGDEYQKREYSEFSPKVNLMYTLKEKRSFTLSYSRGFRAPSLSELYLQHSSSYGLIQLGNPNLLAENVNSFELSYEHPHSANFYWNLSLFHNQYENMIDFVYTIPVTAVNRSGVEGYGFEYGINWRIFDKITLLLQYDYLDMRDKEDIPVLYRPKNKLKTSLNIRSEKINILFSGRYWDEQTYEDFLAHDYELINGKVIFPLKTLPKQFIPEVVFSKNISNYKISLKISNLFDAKYQLIQNYPMPGRSIDGTLTKSI